MTMSFFAALLESFYSVQLLAQISEPIVELRVTPNELSIGDLLYYNITLKSETHVNLIKAPNKQTLESKSIEFIDQRRKKYC